MSTLNRLIATGRQNCPKARRSSAKASRYSVNRQYGQPLLIADSEFTIDPTWKYVGSLLWLVGISTALAFCVYLTLLGRIGADRAGYATVVFPAFALIISTFVEGYQWTALSLYGLVLVAIGNVIILSRPKPRVKPRQPML